MDLVPQLGRSPGEGNGNPVQYSYLENPMDRGACWPTVHGVTRSQTQMHTHTRTHTHTQHGLGARRRWLKSKYFGY